VPPDSANTSGGVFLGEALGETFQADHLGIESITVWRVPYEAGYVWGIHLFILPTDSLGNPDISHVLLNGPTLIHADGDGVHPTPFEFVFDPPFQLPKLGLYEFAVQSDPCGGNWDILTVNKDDYADGCAWFHGRSIDPGCPLRVNPGRFCDGDLCFDVRFCDATTPTKKVSWGHIKSIYR